jgi:prolyl-tRNA editing enzyme YbaK/EbsC (Cys-tRNA(Pro) deacylase)
VLAGGRLRPGLADVGLAQDRLGLRLRVVAAGPALLGQEVGGPVLDAIFSHADRVPGGAGRQPCQDGGVMGTLKTEPARERPDLLAEPVRAALAALPDDLAGTVLVAPIDPGLADTAAFCAAYEIGLDVSANCVVVAGKRDGVTRYAACMILATTRADVNGVIRRRLDVRKASFAPMDTAVAETGMEYGGITPIGMPDGWPILVDARVAATPYVIIGSGVRHSKIALPGQLLTRLPGAEVTEELARQIDG